MRDILMMESIQIVNHVIKNVCLVLQTQQIVFSVKGYTDQPHSLHVIVSWDITTMFQKVIVDSVVTGVRVV
jgi:hypothetical protein